MQRRRLYIVAALGLLLAVAAAGVWVLRPERRDLPPGEVVMLVNGDPVLRDDLEYAYEELLEVYRQVYAQSGRNLDRVLEEGGAPGAYLRLQIQYQAAQRLLDRALIYQEAKRRRIALSEAELQEAFERRYRRFLETNGVKEEELRDLLQDPEKRGLTKQLLGIREDSVEELRARFRRETQDLLIRRRVAEALLGPEIPPDSEEGQERLNRWLEEQRARARVEYLDPLLWAYHKEARIAQAETPEEREKALREALAAYQEVKDRRLSDDPYLDFYIAQLYQMEVGLGLEREQKLLERLRELQAQEEERERAEQELRRLEERIEESREKATEFFLSAGVEDERQLQALVMTDPNNPFYIYMYARMLLAKPEGFRLVIRLLPRAIEIDPQYVDAYVLLGDFEMKREHYERALERYRQALEVAQEIQGREDAKLKMLDNDLNSIRRKLAEAYLAVARRQLDQREQEREGQGEREGEQPSRSAADGAGAGIPPREALERAESLLQRVLSEISEEDFAYPKVWTALGDVAYLRGDYESARERYERALEILDDDRVRVKLAEALLAAGDLDGAERVLAVVLERSPKWAPAHVARARLHRARGEIPQAIEAYKQALRYSTELDYLKQRAIALEALELDPEDADLHLMLGHVYLQNRVYAGAVKAYERALELDPDRVAAYGGLARVALEKRDPEKALEHLRRGLAKDPTLKERIGLYELVLEADRQRVGPGNPLSETGKEALLRLAELYLEAGRPADSYQKLAWLRERYPDFRREEVEALFERLEELAGGRLPGEPVPDQGHAHIAPGDPHPPYNSKPPTSGPHYPIPAAWGIHAVPIPDEVQLRNLAGGGVLLQYRPDLDPETQQKLRDLVQELRTSGKERYCRLIVAPYEGLEHPIVLTAWTRIDRLEAFDRDRILRFIDAFINKGPEVNEVRCDPPPPTSRPGTDGKPEPESGP